MAYEDVLSLPEPERRTFLLAALGDLLRGAGWQQFVSAPIVLPIAAHFPERWSPDVVGVRRLIRRLFHYADLSLDAHVELFEGRPPQVDSLGLRLGASATHHRGAAGLYFGTHDGVAHFGADAGLLDDAGSVTATLAHEVAHAFRERHDLCEPDPTLEEQLTDLTTIYLGFGVLNTNAALRHRSGVSRDAMFSHQWSTQRLGYLSPQEMCFLLAAQAHLRGPARADVREIAAHLEPNQAAWFRVAFKWLAVHAQDLAAELGLPPAAEWPPPADLAALSRPLADTDDPVTSRIAPLVDVDVPPPDPVRPVFRVWRRPWSDRLLVVLVVVLTATVAGVELRRDPVALGLVVTLALLAVVATGHYLRPRCSDPACQARLTRAATACPRCRGTIAGDLEFADQRLAAEETLRAQQQQHAGP